MALFVSPIFWYRSFSVSALRPCHGKLPLKKYINICPRASKSSRRLCSVTLKLRCEQPHKLQFPVADQMWMKWARRIFHNDYQHKVILMINIFITQVSDGTHTNISFQMAYSNKYIIQGLTNEIFLTMIHQFGYNICMSDGKLPECKSSTKLQLNFIFMQTFQKTFSH